MKRKMVVASIATLVYLIFSAGMVVSRTSCSDYSPETVPEKCIDHPNGPSVCAYDEFTCEKQNCYIFYCNSDCEYVMCYHETCYNKSYINNTKLTFDMIYGDDKKIYVRNGYIRMPDLVWWNEEQDKEKWLWDSVKADDGPIMTTLKAYRTNLDKNPNARECTTCFPNNPCQNGGKCIEKNGQPTCNCDGTGYTGKNCTKCKTKELCQNGKCQVVNRAAKCVCDKGYTGDYCNKDINECKASPCRNSTCGNTEGSYTCTCNKGFEKSADSSRCTDIDECDAKYIPKVCSHGTCLNNVSSYTCFCGGGFVQSDDGLSCVDINKTPKPDMIGTHATGDPDVDEGKVTAKPGDGGNGTIKPGDRSTREGGKGTRTPGTTDGGSGEWFPDLGIPNHWLVVIGVVVLAVVVGVGYFFCQPQEPQVLPIKHYGVSSDRHSISSRQSMASQRTMGRPVYGQTAMNPPQSAMSSYGTPTTMRSTSRASSASRKKSSTSRGSSKYRSSSYY